MNHPFLHSHSRLHFTKISCGIAPKTSTKLLSFRPITVVAAVPARDRVIDFGKHKGKMLGTLPSTYLKWVSKNLRALDFEEWAILADRVLEDPVYRDRIEWEFAERVLNGSGAPNSRLSRSDQNAVSELLDMSKRFGWDNDDKVGWSKIDFGLLGTSKGGRIPRVVGKKGALDGESRSNKPKKGKLGENCNAEDEEDGQRRRERRERLKTKRMSGTEKRGIGAEASDDGKRAEMDNDRTAVIRNPFPGRQALLRRVLDRKTL